MVGMVVVGYLWPGPLPRPKGLALVVGAFCRQVGRCKAVSVGWEKENDDGPLGRKGAGMTAGSFRRSWTNGGGGGGGGWRADPEEEGGRVDGMEGRQDACVVSPGCRPWRPALGWGCQGGLTLVRKLVDER